MKLASLLLALFLAAPALAGEKVGRESTRVTVSPRGMVMGPVQGSVRIVIDAPTPDWYCPSVELIHETPLGPEKSGQQSDCKPYDTWAIEHLEFAIEAGELICRNPYPRRWDWKWEQRLDSGPHEIEVRLTQGKLTKTFVLTINIL